MTLETVWLLQYITLQVALIVAVVILWFELKWERKQHTTTINTLGTGLASIVTAQAQIFTQVNETQQFVTALMRDKSYLPVPAPTPTHTDKQDYSTGA